ncbi:MAG: hypothetical protein A2067_03540 [Deltaproteobacteria bacterium GWB2_42_7]|nr:MAG: hypothetical protein A2067_03540 [Deltaproteobacteria bacterium GWB2_42_7]
MTIGELGEFLKPTPRKLVIFAILVGIEYLFAAYCQDLVQWLPLSCPPRAHIFLQHFGYFGYIAFYVLSCLLVYISHLMWLDRI